MQISYSQDLISINIEEDSKTFYFLQNLAKKNFAKKIGKRSKIIIFKHAEESVQRRYFLKLIAKLYTEKNKKIKKEELEAIKNSYDKDIKISLTKSNQILQCININMSIEDDLSMKFVFDTKNSLIINYLIKYFKDHAIDHDERHLTLNIKPLSSKTATLLTNLLERKELLGSFVNFNYDKNQYDAYMIFLENKRFKDLIQDSLYEFLEEHYRILGCSKEDSFKTIRERYLKLAKRYHPDAKRSNSDFLNKCYTKKFHAIQNAYKAIKIYFDHEKKGLFVA